MSLLNEEQEQLIRVGPGTPSGEVFRRYWIPVECTANLGAGTFTGANNPLRLTVLGEHLVLFRDGSGKPGLVAEHCSHRGTSLYYGRVEDTGIRCLYHGWCYDREGNVIETPAEPPDSNFKLTVKHPTYPTYEVGGLIFAYMGPPEKIPPFPRYHQLFMRDGIDGVRVVGNGGYVQHCNVFQVMQDNNMDPWHNEIAHGWFRGGPPKSIRHWGQSGDQPTPFNYDKTPWGTRHVNLDSTGRPGRYMYHETHTVFPFQRCNQEWGKSMKWSVPVDDYRTRWFTVDFFPMIDGEPPKAAARTQQDRFNIGHVENLPDDWVDQVGAWWNLGHPWRQGNVWEDDVAQCTQGPIERHGLPDWEKWHLATSDRGIILSREVWREQMERVRQGLDPLGIVRGPEAEELIHITSDAIECDWETGMRLFNMTAEERLAMLKSDGPHSLAGYFPTVYATGRKASPVGA